LKFAKGILLYFGHKRLLTNKSPS